MAQLIYLIRHGETDANKNGVYQGSHVNEPLNQNGVIQAERLGLFLKNQNIGIKTIYASPARRALNTAAIIAHCLEDGSVDGEGFKIPAIVVRPDMYEIDHGDWDGKTYEEVRQIWPDILQKWHFGNQLKVSFPNGEKISAAIKRINRAIKNLIKEEAENTAIVAHGGVLAIFLAGLLKKKDFRSIKQNNACFNIVARRGNKIEVLAINSTAHLF